MKDILTKNLICVFFCAGLVTQNTCAQGFINFDFENGQFIPIPGDPFGRLQFGAAMPGWAGYVGANQINWIMYNNFFLDTAGISIWGPNQPQPDIYHGQFFVELQRGLDPVAGSGTVSAAIAQTGTIPAGVQSIRFLTDNPVAAGIAVFFNSTQLPLYHLGANNNGSQIWGGDISAYANQTGELRFRGQGFLDDIQFSNQPIPEPSAFSLFGLGALLLGWWYQRNEKAS